MPWLSTRKGLKRAVSAEPCASTQPPWDGPESLGEATAS